MATSSDYRKLLNAVENYYGSGSDQWAYIFQNLGSDASTEEVVKILKQTPGVELHLNANGRILDYSVNDVLQGFSSTENIGNAINSNNISSTIKNSVSANIPSIITKEATTGKLSGISGIGLKADTGLTATGVLSTVGVALGAVGIGAKLGKIIGDSLYNSNPNIWDDDVISGLSQVDWNKFATTLKDDVSGRVQNGILGLFGVDGDNTTMYLDENAVGYLTWYMTQNILKDEIDFPPIPSEDNPLTISDNVSITLKETLDVALKSSKENFIFNDSSLNSLNTFIEEYNNKYCFIKILNKDIDFGGWSPLSITVMDDSIKGKVVTTNPAYLPSIKTLQTYGTGKGDINISNTQMRQDGTIRTYVGEVYYDGYFNNLSSINISLKNIDGVSNNDKSTQFNPTGIGSVSTALGALKNQFPELWDKSITKTVPQEDGSEEKHVYLPIPIPKFNNAFDTQPTTGTPDQKNPEVDPSTTPEEEQKNLADTIAPPPTPSKDPNTGKGDSPSIILPSQNASSLWAIYNPSLAQLNQLGSWLWSTNFIDQILKIFNDPMQAIIGLHKVYATPNISGSGNIKVGYLDSGVPSNIVGNQYTYIDCGTVSLREYYGNILDYSPYTTVQLYLPFIGIVSLDIADVSRSNITVKYGVDVLTGACLASVSVQRDNAGGILYQYSGNCACQYPLSSGSYMGMVTGALGAIGSLARGNIIGTGLSVAGMHANIERSGGFSGNAGAMGIKKPYLIISRPQSAMNDGFPSIQGYPSNHYTRLGNCSGFIQVAECHVENISATDKELDKIKNLLKEGVIL